MIRYRADTKRATVVAVECEKAGYPNLDADGEKQFDNTHFDDEYEAWEKLDAELRACVSLSGDRVREARRQLRRARRGLSDAAERWIRSVANRCARNREREREDA